MGEEDKNKDKIKKLFQSEFVKGFIVKQNKFVDFVNQKTQQLTENFFKKEKDKSGKENITPNNDKSNQNKKS